MSFELSKWYADCTTAAGDALILYSAELRWRGPAIHYASLLGRVGGKGLTRSSLRKQMAPVESGGRVEWRSRAWDVDACWSELASGISHKLFECSEGKLEWNCLAPKAAARIRIGETELSGCGYVEHLRLTVAPWRLPIRSLRWGRFLGGQDALVWIDWRGDYNCRFVVLNGEAVDAERVADGEVALAGGAVLRLEQGLVMRDGALGSTVLAVIPKVERVFPARILKVRERKWLSRGVLRGPGRVESEGWAIHEVVEWP